MEWLGSLDPEGLWRFPLASVICPVRYCAADLRSQDADQNEVLPARFALDRSRARHGTLLAVPFGLWTRERCFRGPRPRRLGMALSRAWIGCMSGTAGVPTPASSVTGRLRPTRWRATRAETRPCCFTSMSPRARRGTQGASGIESARRGRRSRAVAESGSMCLATAGVAVDLALRVLHSGPTVPGG